jgi:hypothetical protein
MTKGGRRGATVVALSVLSMGLAVPPATADPCPTGPEGSPEPCVTYIDEPSMIMTMGHLCCWRMGLEPGLGV